MLTAIDHLVIAVSDLAALFGRRAGTRSDFEYSVPLREAGRRGLVWTAEMLDGFLENPESSFQACG